MNHQTQAQNRTGLGLAAQFPFVVQPEMSRLQQKAIRLQTEIEQASGGRVESTPEERRLLAEKAKGIDPETLDKASVLDPKDRKSSDLSADSAENR